jgi:homopolymeric O-antigen transport system permease protein
MGQYTIKSSRVRSPLSRNSTILLSMIRRNIRLKYHSSVFGFAWSLLGPLLLIALLITVFTNVIRIPIEDYWAFLISGYFSWHYFNAAIFYSANALEEHATLIRNFYFPCEIALVAGALSRLVDFLVAIATIALVLSIFHHGDTPVSLLWLPALVILQFLLTLGPMLLVATVAIFNEDLKHMLPLLLTALFYATPIFYPVDLVPDSIMWLYFLNPVAQLMELFHHVLYQGEAPPLATLLLLTFQAVVLLLIGYIIFNRYRGSFADLA